MTTTNTDTTGSTDSATSPGSVGDTGNDMGTGSSGPLNSGLSALARARQIRAAALADVALARATATDILRQAATKDGQPLLRLSLRQLMLAEPGATPTHTDRLLDRIDQLCPLPAADRSGRRHVTVGWLLDPRAGGRRWLAWLDTAETNKHAPWPGFPYTPQQPSPPDHPARP